MPRILRKILSCFLNTDEQQSKKHKDYKSTQCFQLFCCRHNDESNRDDSLPRRFHSNTPRHRLHGIPAPHREVADAPIRSVVDPSSESPLVIELHNSQSSGKSSNSTLDPPDPDSSCGGNVSNLALPVLGPRNSSTPTAVRNRRPAEVVLGKPNLAHASSSNAPTLSSDLAVDADDEVAITSELVDSGASQTILAGSSSPPSNVRPGPPRCKYSLAPHHKA